MQKGAEYFVQLARRVVEKIPSALFVVAGSGNQYHSLMLHGAGQGLSANLLFTGFIRGRNKEALLDRTDVFVMPSVSEPFGLVALEAAQRHTPVIVSTNSGASEVLSTSVKADFWDVDKMAQEIERLLEDEQYRQQVVAGQNKDLQNLTWSKASQEIQQIYHQVHQGKRS
jgi:glycosyltransferase involved in cell wall biosynthesis